jgi:heme/copper-type cytochrome/quinol oxidase subunit 2
MDVSNTVLKGERMRPAKYSVSVFLVMFLFIPWLSVSAETETATSQIGADGIQRVDVLAGSYFFNPNRIILKVNVPVELKLKKESGLVPHDITMKSPEAGMDFQVGLSTDPKVLSFIPKRTGTYPFYCSKKFLGESHREKGMQGTIEVIP